MIDTKTADDATAFGFQVHCGQSADGALAGRHWWTLMRDGWGEPEVSPADWATAERAWTNACVALVSERELERDAGAAAT